MDWILIGAIIVAGWAMLSVMSSERLGQAQRIAVALAKEAAEKAKAKEDDVPIARSIQPPSTGNQVRKAA